MSILELRLSPVFCGQSREREAGGALVQLGRSRTRPISNESSTSLAFATP